MEQPPSGAANKCPRFHDFEGSVKCQLQLLAGRYLEPNESSHILTLYIFKIHFSIILFSTSPKPPRSFLSFRFYD
jgi:hypothetical protein